jgi:hypothetical protein
MLLAAIIVIAASIGWITFELLWTWIHGRNLKRHRAGLR